MTKRLVFRESRRTGLSFIGFLYRRHRRIYGLLAFFSIFLIALCFFPVGALLDFCLVVDSPLERADAVVIGATGGVLNEAVRLFQEGYADCILINCRVPEKYKNVNVPVTPCHFIREDLQKAGVPDESILNFDSGTTNLVESQLAFRRFLKEHGIQSYILQPARLHTRLTSMIHTDTFPEGDVRLVMVASDGRLVLRKEITGIHNTFIRMGYWRFVHRPHIREALERENEGKMAGKEKMESE